MISLYQIDGGLVPPVADARLYEFLSGGAVGVVEGMAVTSLGGLQLSIADGWGVVLGRVFSVETETITVSASSGDAVNGRLIVQIDTANADAPISFVTQAAATLPDLIQEDINASGTIYQLPLATYTVDATQITDLTSVAPVADVAFMPVSGGTFSGEVKAINTSRTGSNLRNITVWDAAGNAQSTNYILMKRK